MSTLFLKRSKAVTIALEIATALYVISIFNFSLKSINFGLNTFDFIVEQMKIEKVTRRAQEQFQMVLQE